MSKLREEVEYGTVKRDVGVACNAQCKKRSEDQSPNRRFHDSQTEKGYLWLALTVPVARFFIFKDDSIEPAIEEATLAVWARMQLEE